MIKITKLQILELLDDIFYELDLTGMSDVTFKDVIDYIYKNNKVGSCPDNVTKELLKRYLNSVKTEADDNI
jgi:hypothetical protein